MRLIAKRGSFIQPPLPCRAGQRPAPSNAPDAPDALNAKATHVIGRNYLRRTSALVGSALRRDGEACSRILAESIVQTPNYGRAVDAATSMSARRRRWFGIDHELHIEVGNAQTEDGPSPRATLVAWVCDPKLAASSPTDSPDPRAHGDALLESGDTQCVTPPGTPSATNDQSPQSVTPRGTIILVHGYHDKPYWMLLKARRFAAGGYRAVVIALRGHSHSTGDYHTYGLIEKHDISQVIDALEARELIAGKLGIWGISYGSTTSIETAAIDRRIEAVVALAGFSSMRAVTPHYVKMMAPFLALTASDAYLQQVITKAGVIAGFDPDKASAAEAIGQIDSPVLLVHGKRDLLVPVHHAHTLHEASNANVKLILHPWFGHIALAIDPIRRIDRTALDFFDQHLASPAPTLASSPARSSTQSGGAHHEATAVAPLPPLP